MRITSGGNVGIGITDPQEKLHVNGTIRSTSLIAQSITLNGETLGLWSDNNNVISYTGGDVTIGVSTPNSGAKLTVNGRIASTEVKVEAINGPDYVFKEDYQLKSISEVEDFIQANNHLPGIPSAKEMAKNGVQLGEFNMLLLQKIEELTLYAIEQQKQIDKLKAKIEE